MRLSIVLSAMLCGVFLAAGASQAAEPGASAQKEVSTAITHAGFAAAASDAKTVHLHLHHVINCLVGAGGRHFDAKAGDPCQGQGHGALRDAKAAKAGDAVRTRLAQALHLAVIGVEVQGAAPAANVAKAVEGILKEADHAMQPKHG